MVLAIFRLQFNFGISNLGLRKNFEISKDSRYQVDESWSIMFIDMHKVKG